MKNVRGAKKWFSGVHRIPDEIAGEIGTIVSLLQTWIDKGHFVKTLTNTFRFIISNPFL